MTHPAAERLSEYLDEELPVSERRVLEAHLRDCSECATLLSELRRVLSRAQALEDRPPRHDLWPGVAAAIGAAPHRPRWVSLPVPLLLAAGIALMVLSGGTVALLLKDKTTGVALNPAGPEATVTALPATSIAAERGYDAAIRILEQQLASGRGRLDSATVRVVEEKLRLIDRAIAQAERALASDSANSYLQGHLTQTRLSKLDLLRRATGLTRSVS